MAKFRIMFARWEMNDAVDAAANAGDSPILEVLEEELRGVPCLGRLARREMALLSDRKLENAVPVRGGLRVGGHYAKRNQWFSSVQTHN